MNVIDKIDLKLNESDSGNLLIYESLFYGFYFCGIMFYLICNGCDYIINLIMLYVVWYFFKIGSVKII